MNILARVDVSETVGFGHLFRTIEISKYFKGSKIIFLINSSNKKIFKILKEKKIFFKIIKSKKITYKYIEKVQTKKNQSVDANKTVKIAKFYNVKLIIVDDYKKDYIWHKIIKDNNINLAVIDDLNNKKFFCDFYINFNKEKKEIRKNLLLKKCKIITGRTNNPFIYKNFKKRYNDKIDRIHLCLSSAVNKKIVLDIIKTLNDFQKKNKPEMKLKLNVFCMYYDFSFFKKLNFNFLNIRCFNNSKNYLDDIKKADLGIGFAGMSMFDRISNLLPSLNFAISKNQAISLEDDYLKKFMYSITLKKKFSYKDKIKKQIEFFLKNKKLRKKIFKNLNKLPKKLNLKIKNLC